MSEKSIDTEIKTEIVSTLSFEEMTNNCKVNFIIHNFCQLNDSVWSENFTIGSDDEWSLFVNPIYTDDNMKYLSASLLLDKSRESMIKAKFNLFITNFKNEEKYKTVTKLHDFKPGTNWGFRRFIKREDLLNLKLELLPNNKLTLVFEIQIINQMNPKSYTNFDFENIMNDQSLSDFQFVVKGKEFFVHKLILSSRSSVFKAMFKNDMKEKKENEAIIDDIESDVFQEFLNFVYLGKLDKMETMAEQLLQVSDKYNVVDLKSICEDFIYSKITIENAVQTLLIGDKFNANKLQFRAIQYINDNMNDIRNSSMNEWLQFIQINQQLTDQIFQLSGNRNFTTNTAKKQNTKKSFFKSYTYHNFN